MTDLQLVTDTDTVCMDCDRPLPPGCVFTERLTGGQP